MKARELRIGNLYKQDCIDGDYAQITAQDILDLNNDSLDDYYKPIPLTAEWLLDFGFDKSIDHYSPEYLWGKEEYGNPRRAVGIYNPDNKEDWYMTFREDVGIGWVELNEIQFVHQLQNLYFALTNEELERRNP